MRKTALVVAAALALGTLGMATAPTPAEAGVRVGGGIQFHFGQRLFFPRQHFGGPRIFFRMGPSCHWLKVKALRSHNPIWWHRYRDCRINRDFW